MQLFEIRTIDFLSNSTHQIIEKSHEILYLCNKNFYTMSKKKKNNKNEVNEPTEHYRQPLNFDKVWLMFQETGRKFQETDKKIKELSNLFTTQWGKLIESLVEGDLIRLLNEKGIEVHQTSQRVSGSYKGKSYEFDIIAANDEEIVVVEVKTTLRVDDVKNFLIKLPQFKTWMPVYKEKKIYGAVAFLTSASSSHIMAENKGLFVIKATGNSSCIVNEDGFEPKAF